MLEDDEVRLLHSALTGDIALTEELLSRSPVDINCVHPVSGMTPLCCATHGGHMAIVVFLIRAGANIDQQCSLGSAVLIASVLGYAEIVDTLCSHGADYHAKGENGISPLNAACTRGNLAVVTVLANHEGADFLKEQSDEDSDGLTAFGFAFSGDRFNVLRYLVEVHGIDVNAPLRKCSKTRLTPLFFAASQGSVPMVSFLLELGAEVDRATEEGETPLFTACRCGAFSVVSCLLEHHANVNAATSDGSTPLLAAIHSRHEPTIMKLLEYGADVSHGDSGVTPLSMAISKGLLDVMRALVDHGATVGNGLPAEALLHLACRKGNVRIVQYLLNLNSSLREACVRDRWVLRVIAACEYKHHDLVWFFLQQMVAGSMFERKNRTRRRT